MPKGHAHWSGHRKAYGRGERPLRRCPTMYDVTETRIGSIAKEFGLNPKTIRYYEEVGLVPPPERNPMGHRVYGDRQREALAFVLSAKGVGFTLDEIRRVVAVRGDGQSPCATVRSLIEVKLTEIDAQVQALAELRRALVRLRDRPVEAEADPSICSIIEGAPVVVGRTAAETPASRYGGQLSITR